MAGIAQVANVVSHIPRFIRNSPGGTQDADIQNWIDSRWEEIQAVLVRRSLAVPALGTDGYQQLELLNRLGAASDLAAAVSNAFSPNVRWQVEKNLRDDYIRMLARLDNGEMDKLLNPLAKTADVTPGFKGVAGGDTEITYDPNANVFFQRGQVF